jgi:hypothetical protein
MKHASAIYGAVLINITLRVGTTAYSRLLLERIEWTKIHTARDAVVILVCPIERTAAKRMWS